MIKYENIQVLSQLAVGFELVLEFIFPESRHEGTTGKIYEGLKNNLNYGK